MDHRDDAHSAADRLYFPSPADVPWHRDRHARGTDRALRWEPAFCVLPGTARPAPVGEPADGGSW